MDAAIHASTPRPASTLSGGGSRRARERAIEAVLASAALVTVIVLVGIFGVLVVKFSYLAINVRKIFNKNSIFFIWNFASEW